MALSTARAGRMPTGWSDGCPLAVEDGNVTPGPVPRHPSGTVASTPGGPMKNPRAAFPILIAACAVACTVTVQQQPTPAPQPVTVVQQTPAPAPPPPPVTPPPAPEPTRVGRLALLLGTVSFRPEV